MLISIVADDHSPILALADSLRAAGHATLLRGYEPGEGVGEQGSVESFLVLGVSLPPDVERAATESDNLCVIALLHQDELSQFTPGGACTDFAVAPFRAEEVALRIALHQRRMRAGEGEVIRSGALAIDVDNYTVTVHEERIELTFKEYELLRFLVSHPGRVFTRESLLEQVWGYDYWGGSRTIDVHIRRIRSKLPESTAASIETVHQVGYRYAAPRG